MRYYLDMFKATFKKLHKTRVNAKGQYVENGHYDEEVANLFAMFSRIHSTDFDNTSPKRLDNSSALVEVDLDVPAMSTEYLDSLIDIKDRKALQDEHGYIPEFTELYLLNKLVSMKLIRGFGHWPHRNDGNSTCIHCYLEKYKSKWFKEE